MTGFSIRPDGTVPDADAYGVQLDVGAYAYHNWKRTHAGLDYRADFRHYSRAQYYDGSNHFLTFNVGHQPSPRLVLGARASMGTFSRTFGYFGSQLAEFASTPLATPIQVPANELFDNRTMHFSGIGSASYRLSARLSLTGFGGGFLVSRRARGLLGSSGTMAGTELAYALSRRSGVSVGYSIVDMSFSKMYGGAIVQNIGAGYQYRVSRFWDAQIGVAAFRISSDTLRVVTLDPIVAQITGLTQGYEATNASVSSFGGQVGLRRTFRRGALSISLMRGVTPGNGLYTVSRQDSASIVYTYTALRRWNLGFNAHYSRLSSVVEPTFGGYRSLSGGVGVGRSLRHGFHMVSRFDLRNYRTGLANFRGRTQSHVSLGISYSPGDIPLALW